MLSVFQRLSPHGFSTSKNSAGGMRFWRDQRPFGFRWSSISWIASSSRSSPIADAFASAYPDVNERDHAALVGAVHKGRIRSAA
jgi:hypothetical protein